MEQPASPQIVRTADHAGTTDVPVRKPLLLIVDDDEGVRAALNVIFEQEFEVGVTSTGREALEFVSSRAVDVVTLDLDLPGLTGIEVLEQLKQHDPLMEVVDWARNNVASTLCSCLATHAMLKRFYGIERQPLPEKRWGVYSHRLCVPGHPLLREINTRFDVPHSRFNDISRAQLERAGLTVLAESEEGGVHMAVSPDQFRLIFFQGHPEYDTNSLLKEYKREVFRYLNGELPGPPPHPEHYFSAAAAEAADRYVREAERALREDRALPDDLEDAVEPELDNTWGDTAKAIVNNWLGLVYQVTNLDRRRQYMEGVDPADPLGLQN